MLFAEEQHGPKISILRVDKSGWKESLDKAQPLIEATRRSHCLVEGIWRKTRYVGDRRE